MRHRKKSSFSTFVIVFTIVIFIIAIIYSMVLSFNDHSYTITVTDKERVNKEEESKYLIFGEDENGNIYVFENTDSLLRLKFNSSDIYAKIKEGETYTFTVIGLRIPIFSEYENIIEVKWGFKW